MANGHLRDVVALHHLLMTTLSVGDAAAVIEHVEWLRSLKRSPNTITDRAYLLARLNNWLAKQQPPKTLGTATEDDLAAWQRSISRMSANTIATYVGHAAGYYRWLAKYHHLPDVSGLLMQPSIPKGLPRPIADQDLHDLLHLADGTVLRTLLLAAFCGARVGEVARLQRHDIREDDDPPTVVFHGKGQKMRAVRMPSGLGQQLRAAGLPMRGNIVLSPSTGQPYSPNRLGQVVNSFMHDQGVAATIHSARHWYGTNIYRITKDIRLVQTMLGHASPATTAIYTAFDPPNADEMVAGLDAKIARMVPGFGPPLRVVRREP
jgi:site-specific recombinase XerD